MTFMIKKKRYKFVVELVLDELTEVSYSKGIMFAKIRQLDGGSFTDVSKRVEVQNHAVKYNDRFLFPCKMYAGSSSVILETCKCRISIRMEEKGGKHFRKIGFADINMAEYAGAGTSTQKYILQAYDTSHRLDNSMLQITLNLTLKEGDTIFQRPPLNRSAHYIPPGEEDNTPSSTKTLTVPTSASDLVKFTNSPLLSTVPSSVTCGTIMSSSVAYIGGGELTLEDNNHSRNSSATSQTSAGYISCSNGQQQPQQLGHSRQSSSGDSSHGSYPMNSHLSFFFNSFSIKKNPGILRVHSFFEVIGHTFSGTNKTYSFPGDISSNAVSAMEDKFQQINDNNRSSSLRFHPRYFHRRTMSNIESNKAFNNRDCIPRNLSQGSSDTGFYGSMEKEKNRRKKLDEGRVDPELVIKELMEGVDLDKVGQDDAETSGLQLFVGKDGTFTFDKSSSRKKDFEPVVMF
ncbi:EEIG family member 2 isoform X2 [Lepeophtheirus salmonis]|uniref:EEIG family member 2 isoform X2 n=1 Tax=Lepeophtheirus salmonis TaxID=72036 RepID=UPI001AE74AE2|nr:protein FAM102B-like isoform X2 [Lepeophtheirus salmonis]